MQLDFCKRDLTGAMLANASFKLPPASVVLVTGGSGLVGKALKELVDSKECESETWIFLSSADGDLRDEKVVFELFARYKPTHVIHLAALVGGLFKNMKLQADFLNDNIAINGNVLRAAHASNVAKVISCLSTCIFPDKTTYPIDESMVHLGPPHDSNFGYAYAKRMLDVANRAYHSQYGRTYTSIIPTNIFGPHDNFHLEDSHVIPGLIHKCYLARERNEPFVVMGSGTPRRQFIYSRDLAKLVVWALHSYSSVEPIILSVSENEELSIRQVADAVVREMEFNGEYRFDSSKADGQLKKTADNSKLLRLLKMSGYEFEFTQFDTAMAETVKWFCDEYPNVRK